MITISWSGNRRVSIPYIFYNMYLCWLTTRSWVLNFNSFTYNIGKYVWSFVLILHVKKRRQFKKKCWKAMLLWSRCTKNLLQISCNVAWKLLSRKTKLFVHDTDGQVRSPVSYWFSVSGHRLWNFLKKK